MLRRILPGLRYMRTGRIPNDVALNATLAVLDGAFDRLDVEGMVAKAMGLGVETGPRPDAAVRRRTHLTMIPGGAR